MSDGEPKPTSQLLDEIQKADATALKDVSTQESNQSAKHDMTMVRKSFHYYFHFHYYVIPFRGIFMEDHIPLKSQRSLHPCRQTSIWS